MAEASDAPQQRFYCHCCKRETEPKLPDFICPTCESDFIEEVSEDSSLLRDSTASVTNEESNLLFPDIWQLLFMERSALLSNPPSSESLPEDDQQVSAGSCSRSWLTCLPAMETCLLLPPHCEHAFLFHRRFRFASVAFDFILTPCENRPLSPCSASQVGHAAVVLQPGRLRVGSGRPGCRRHRVVRAAGEHRSTPGETGEDLIAANSLHLSRTERLPAGMSSLQGGIFTGRICQEAPLPPLLPR
ncbi:uncharacterized protein si:ch211-81a5.1 isoform X2 [Fundulus heteroclitus]|uniref:uncharacterized protein si:ch211-81a5.1 isoform X2 n=1 Tax=Fundulus heteroclitus TaxID=8078 RepID=UPI00165C8E36|nr:uncharacterized protein si:ch211-81a5.1 isoform X2 [Fundulus heteroclitus]